MKLFHLFTFIFVFSIVRNNLSAVKISKFNKINRESLKSAFSDVLKVFFVDEKIPFDVIFLGNPPIHHCDVVNDALHKIDVEIHPKIHYVTNTSSWSEKSPFKLNKSAVIVASAEVLQDIDRKSLLVSRFPMKMKFLIYGQHSDYIPDYFLNSINREHNFSYLTTFNADQFVIYQYHLHDSMDSIGLSTYEWFSPETCNKIHKIQLNKFVKATQQWQHHLKNHEKFQNFHKCPFLVDQPNIISEKLHSHMRVPYNIFDAVADRRNMTVHYDFWIYPTPEQRYQFYKYQLKYSELKISQFEEFHFTKTFADEEVQLFLSPARSYTIYEKTLMPFDQETWVYLGGIFGVAFAVIFIVNWLPKKLRNHIYGEGVNMPAFNVIGTFFGIGQMKLPQGNFARIILMTFILFCLVMRTAYQGVMFDLMTRDVKEKQVTTIEELFDLNYTIYLVKSVSIAFGGVDLKINNLFRNYYGNRKSLLNIIPIKFFYINCDDLLDETVKNAVLAEETMRQSLYYRCSCEFDILAEVFMKIPVGYAMDPNHYLFSAFDEVVNWLIAAGIPQQIRKYYKWIENSKIKIREINREAQMFKLGDLSFGFYIWLCACGISSIVFLFEMSMWFRVRKEKRLREIKNATSLNVEIPEIANANDIIQVKNKNQLNDYENLNEIDEVFGEKVVIELLDIKDEESKIQVNQEFHQVSKVELVNEIDDKKLEVNQNFNFDEFFGEEIMIELFEKKDEESNLEKVQEYHQTSSIAIVNEFVEQNLEVNEEICQNFSIDEIFGEKVFNISSGMKTAIEKSKIQVNQDFHQTSNIIQVNKADKKMFGEVSVVNLSSSKTNPRQNVQETAKSSSNAAAITDAISENDSQTSVIDKCENFIILK